jgi:hypothetical protein
MYHTNGMRDLSEEQMKKEVQNRKWEGKINRASKIIP